MMLEIALEADEEWDSSSSWVAARPQGRRSRDRRKRLPAAQRYPSGQSSCRSGLTGDEEVRGLNAHWRGKDKPTNVLSFPMAESLRARAMQTLPAPELLLGDIILAHGVCEREAGRERRAASSEHATHLLVHGTLHLLGYDHHDDADAADMEAREVRALARLGIANPYESPPDGHAAGR